MIRAQGKKKHTDSFKWNWQLSEARDSTLDSEDLSSSFLGRGLGCFQLLKLFFSWLSFTITHFRGVVSSLMKTSQSFPGSEILLRRYLAANPKLHYRKPQLPCG